jgi:type II secretory ATPase GspE/PulE/Tfp pilus assembly ATPase PilB-like protein/ActR/RegA family two-component response regulator
MPHTIDNILKPVHFDKFKEFLANRLILSSENKDQLATLTPFQINSLPTYLDIHRHEITKAMSEYLNMPYMDYIDVKDIQKEAISLAFAKSHNVLVARNNEGQTILIINNPFNMDLIDTLRKLFGHDSTKNISLADSETIQNVLLELQNHPVKVVPIAKKREGTTSAASKEINDNPYERQTDTSGIKTEFIVSAANDILKAAVIDRASDIHIEPKKGNTVVRLRIDGDLREKSVLGSKEGNMMISRFKALGGMDIAERRKPQDGASEMSIGGSNFKLRLATTSTPHGESLIIRLLQSEVKPKTLNELGMSDSQIRSMTNFSRRGEGLILMVGPTGSGKTTTIYSFLSIIEHGTRSIISVEDPVEYRIPFANQQQVNDKAGVTFESLLKSAVRQDPDVLFIGEVRDPFSAKIAMDFASTGHLTISTLHTTNATTAMFRLERLGVSRGTMADALKGIVAQRLIKKLCSHCKQIRSISLEEIELLRNYTEDIPTDIAEPVGCPKCKNTGYYGREGIYEVIDFDAEIFEMVRAGEQIYRIREFMRQRGDLMLSEQAIYKVRRLTFSLKDVHENLLAEETKSTVTRQDIKAQTIQPPIGDETPKRIHTIMVVEDEPVTQKLIRKILEDKGYNVVMAGDGIEALMNIGKGNYDLILSDVSMPNLDGFKFIEMLNQKGISTPVIFLTMKEDPEDEVKGLELGAADFIKKPINKNLLLTRIGRILNGERNVT